MHDLTKFGGNSEDFARLHVSQSAIRCDKHRKNRPPPKGIPKHKPGEKFIRGPIPLNWLQDALQLGDKAGNLAWALWFLVGIQGKNPIRLTKSVCEEFHISTRTSTRLLKRFADADLINLDRCRGRGPDVTLLEVGRRSVSHNDNQIGRS